jgi:hypothetical protein
MKAILSALLAFLFYLPLMGADKKPLTKEGSTEMIETAIRKQIKKPEGEFIRTQIAELQKALPNCRIVSNPTK